MPLLFRKAENYLVGAKEFNMHVIAALQYHYLVLSVLVLLRLVEQGASFQS
jgi:hypothetical protein